MKVRYVSLTEGKEDWLKKGEVYTVLEIYTADDGTRYRLIGGESRTPVLHSAKSFEIVSSKIPSSWVVVSGGPRGFYIEIAPTRWTVPSFWEKFFDQDPAAVKIFDEESYKIVTEED